MRLKDMQRHWARRCLNISRFCSHTLGVALPGSKLIVAYSTGLDSTALLHLLHALSAHIPFSLVAAHAHHSLRSESDQELIHAQQTCADLGVICETIRLETTAFQHDSGVGLEEGARLLRYNFLESIRSKYGADWIVTAHHADDLAEDIILRLIRGTGWPGLGGMPGVDPQRRLLRPIMDWTKNELRAFLKATGVSWCEDASNASQNCTRNRVRHGIMPLLQGENPSFCSAALHLWRLARIDESYWSTTLPTFSPTVREHFLTVTMLDAHQAVRLRLYKAVLDAMGPGQARAKNLLLLDQAWTSKSFDLSFLFPGDKIARVEQNGIHFQFHDRQTNNPE